jgi:integrase
LHFALGQALARMGGYNRSTSAGKRAAVRCLKRLFNLAIQRGYLPEGSNPCRHIAPLKVGDRWPPYCSPEQFQTIVAEASELLWQALIAVIFSTGMRRREAINLTRADIDFKVGELHVTGKIADGYVQEWTPKDHEVRTLPLPEQALNLLTALQAEAPEKRP